MTEEEVRQAISSRLLVQLDRPEKLIPYFGRITEDLGGGWVLFVGYCGKETLEIKTSVNELRLAELTFERGDG